MDFKKLISVILIFSQLGIAAAVASESSVPARTPEFEMMESIVALQGQDLSALEVQSRMNEAFSMYLKKAPQKQRQERLEQALVELGVYTPQQAASFMADARALGAQESSATEMAQKLGRLHPAGAQFSMCWAGYTVGVGGLGMTLGGAFAENGDVVIAGALIAVIGFVVEWKC